MALKLSQLSENDYTEDTAKRSNGVMGFLKDVPRGIGKELGSLATGVGELGRKLQKALPVPQSWTSDPSSLDKGTQANADLRSRFEANTPGEKAGKLIGAAATYLAPTGQVVRAQQGLSRVAAAASKVLEGAPTGLKTVAKATDLALRGGARAIPEAVGTGGVTAVRSGGDLDEGKDEGLLAGGLSLVTGGLGGLARKTYFPELQDSISKALGIQGKVSGTQAVKDIGRKISGLGVLKKYAPVIAVKNADGVESRFDPSNATYDTTIQAWTAAKDRVFNAYTGIAKKAGQKVTADLTPVYNGLLETLNEKRLAPYHKAAEALFEDLNRNFPDYRQADLEDLQTFLKDLNSNTGQAFFKGTADNATAEINAGTARTMRELLDSVITESGDPAYGALRSEYASLKAIEDDLVRKFRQAARKTGGGLQDYMDMLSSGDIISGIVSQQPGYVAAGLTKGFLGQLRRYLVDPERFLQRSFDLVDKKDASEIMLRIFGGNAPQ